MEEYWVWLKGIKGIGDGLGKGLLRHFDTPKNIYDGDVLDLRAVSGIGKKLGEEIRSHRSLEEAYKTLEDMERGNIKLLTLSDPLYPQEAKPSKYAPLYLFYKGVIRKDLMGVSIVGSRRCSSYGKEAAIEASRYLAREGETVISGMAKGIDSYAHTAAIKEGGYTVAFLSYGLNHCYPKEHQSLMDAIEEKGALLTTHLPKEKPKAGHFPDRNRLFAAFSKKVLVIEAGERSGSYLTGKYTLSEGKPLYVLPHEIYNPSGKGCNRLLLNGGIVYLKPEQLIDRVRDESADADINTKAGTGLDKKRETNKDTKLAANSVDKNNTYLNRKIADTATAGNNQAGSNAAFKKKRVLTDEALRIEDLRVEDQNILAVLQEQPKNLRDIEQITEIPRTLLRNRLLYLELEDLVICRGGCYRLKH